MYKKYVDGRELDLSMANLAEISISDIKALPKVDTIDLSCNNLEQLPEDFGDLADQVIRLDLSKNRLSHLPASFGRLRSLQHLDLRGNRLRLLPPSFASLERLRWLDLKDNDGLEPGLARAAGDCLDERACRRCAVDVLAHMRQVAAGLERERQSRLAEERAQAASQRSREAAERAEKREAKKLRRQQEQRQQRQRRDNTGDGQSLDDEEDDDEEEDADGAERRQAAPARRGGCWHRLRQLVLASLVLVLPVLLLVLMGATVCLHQAWRRPVGQLSPQEGAEAEAEEEGRSIARLLQPTCRWLLPLLPDAAVDAAARLLAVLAPLRPDNGDAAK